MSTGIISKVNIQKCFTGNSEVFKDIPGWEGLYQVGSMGTVKSLPRTVVSCTGKVYNRKGKILKLRYSDDGYLKTSLSRDGKDFEVGVHRLMALAFIPNPENKPMVNHLNAVRDDNRIDNLEWCTNAENIQHSFNLGISDNKGDKHPRRKLSMEMVRGIRAELANGKSPKEVAEIFNIKRTNVYAVRLGQNWNYT
jgi:hypothetical protein